MRPTTWVLVAVLVALALITAGPSLISLDADMQKWLGLGFALIGLVTGGFVIRKMNTRLAELSEVAEAIGLGDYSARSEDMTDDAIGLLGRTLNNMGEKIEQAMEDITRQQEVLEQRRSELKQRNDELSREYQRQSDFGDYLASLNAVDINALGDRLVNTLGAVCQVEFVLFYLFDADQKSMMLVSRSGIDDQVLNALSEVSQSGVVMSAVNQRELITVDGIEELKLPGVDLGIGSATISSVTAAPIMFQGHPLGAVLLAGISGFTSQSQTIMSRHIDAFANALNNSLNYKTVQQQSLKLEQANMELVEADRLRSEFVANMSHELRTPLNSIIGFSGILLKNRNAALGDKELNYSEKINRNGKHLLNLINDILDLSKIESGRMELDIRPCSIDSVINDVTDLLQHQVEAKGLSFSIELDESLPEIPLDDQKLKQVIINLVSNAIKFTEKGNIKIFSRNESGERGCLVIGIQDSGIGIPEDKLETIFEAFRQVDASTTRKYGGTGLGLAISRAFIETMGGKIRVSSSEGKGSLFEIELPLKQKPVKPASSEVESSQAPAQDQLPVDDAATEPASSAATGTVDLSPNQETAVTIKPRRDEPVNKILVIDDDADARELLSNYLAEHCKQVLTAADGRVGLEMARNEKPDLITLDLMMPEMNGWEVLNKLKADDELAEIPVIVISIVAETRRAAVLGAVDAITKPVSQSKLSQVLQRCLSDNSMSGAKLLVVDDEPDARDLISNMMSDQVGEIRTAGNGREALSRLEQYQPDLIILDLMMPVMDGLSFLRVLRADKRFIGIPVVVVTAKNLTASERRELELRVAAVVQKGDDHLAERLTEVINHAA